MAAAMLWLEGVYITQQLRARSVHHTRCSVTLWRLKAGEHKCLWQRIPTACHVCVCFRCVPLSDIAAKLQHLTQALKAMLSN